MRSPRPGNVPSSCADADLAAGARQSAPRRPEAEGAQKSPPTYRLRQEQPVAIDSSRRQFLQGAGAFGLGAAALGMVSACTSSATPASGSSGSGSSGGAASKAIVATVSLQGLGQDYLTVLVEPDKTWWNEIFDYPVMQNLGGHYIPGLATSWEPSADKLTWSFDIRDGVKFHNGGDLTADELAIRYNRLMF